MKKLTLLAIVFAATLFASCSKYDDSELRGDIKDLKERVASIEDWCKTTNDQITALQALVTALQEENKITGVSPLMENGKEIGYTISFSKGNPITIKHGTKGDDAIAPIIGVKKDVDNNYYWTVNAEWMLDIDGNKIRTTGNKGENGEMGEAGKTPIITIAKDTDNKYYWQLNGEWLISNGTKVQATGDKGDAGDTGLPGDAIFAEEGIDTSDPNNVTFTLADGVTKITLPRVHSLTIGFDSYETLVVTANTTEINILLPATLKESEYTSMMAEIKSSNGTGIDIKTRASSTPWGVSITKPTFTNGTYNRDAKVTITTPTNIATGEVALLEVTIVDNKGTKIATTRAIKYFDGIIVTNTDGNLSNNVTNTSVENLIIVGSLNATDFAHIKNTLTSLKTLDLSATSITEVPDNALNFADANQTITTITLPASIQTIGLQAFRNCAALESINIPENVTILNKNTFSNCSKLPEIKLPTGLAMIDNAAFFGCQALISIDIPANVKTLGRWVFENCDQLKTITLHEGLASLSPSTFYGCGVETITIPTTVEEIPNWAFEKCNNLKTINLHNSITKIGEGAFMDCEALEQIEIPTSVTEIDAATFQACKNLTSVTMHDNITKIGEFAFNECAKLDNVTLPANLTILGPASFQLCSSLTSIVIPNGVTELPSVFPQCTSLGNITLSNNLKRIGDNEFNNSALETIEIPASVKTFGGILFVECRKLKTITLHAVTPPAINTDNSNPTFTIGIKEITLLVPNKEDYSAWEQYFMEIQGIN